MDGNFPPNGFVNLSCSIHSSSTSLAFNSSPCYSLPQIIMLPPDFCSIWSHFIHLSPLLSPSNQWTFMDQIKSSHPPNQKLHMPIKLRVKSKLLNVTCEFFHILVLKNLTTWLLHSSTHIHPKSHELGWPRLLCPGLVLCLLNLSS
jgi:hypothetical protein